MAVHTVVSVDVALPTALHIAIQWNAGINDSTTTLTTVDDDDGLSSSQSLSIQPVRAVLTVLTVHTAHSVLPVLSVLSVHAVHTVCTVHTVHPVSDRVQSGISCVAARHVIDHPFEHELGRCGAVA